MGRAPCCQKLGLNRGAWTTEEDNRLVDHILKYGHANWRQLPKQAGLLRCGKSCRLRWINYLRPDIKRGNFTREEEETIIKLHEIMGNKWSHIAACLPGRTDNEIKNVWNTNLKKKIVQPTNNLKRPTSSPSISSSVSCSDRQDDAVIEADRVPEDHNIATQNSNEMDFDDLNMEVPFDPTELCNILDDSNIEARNSYANEEYDQSDSHSNCSLNSMGILEAYFPDILIEPELLNDVGQLGPINHTHQACLEGESNQNWLVELEQEMDSWGTTTTDDGQLQQKGNPSVEIEVDDLVCSYFQMPPPTSTSILDWVL